METQEKLTEKIKQLKAAAKNEHTFNEFKIQNYFEKLLTGYSASIIVELNLHEIRVKITTAKACLDPFHNTSFTLTYESKYDFSNDKYLPARLEMNVGTCITFDVKDDKEYIDKIKTMSIVLDHTSEIESLFASIDTSAQKEYNEAIKDFNAMIYWVNIHPAAKVQLTAKNLFEGLAFYNKGKTKNGVDFYWKARIVGITSQYVRIKAKGVTSCVQYNSEHQNSLHSIIYTEELGSVEKYRLIDSINNVPNLYIFDLFDFNSIKEIKSIKTTDTPEDFIEKVDI